MKLSDRELAKLDRLNESGFQISSQSVSDLISDLREARKVLRDTLDMIESLKNSLRLHRQLPALSASKNSIVVAQGYEYWSPEWLAKEQRAKAALEERKE